PDFEEGADVRKIRKASTDICEIWQEGTDFRSVRLIRIRTTTATPISTHHPTSASRIDLYNSKHWNSILNQ
ncbi:unnamed protein product, partial [Strongylus vulgaris]